MNYGALTLALAVLGVLAWLTFLVTHSRIRRRREAPPQNQSPFLDDTQLELSRLSRVLLSALAATAILAIVLPIYYLNESDRQVAAAERFDEIAVHRGEEWYLEFQCGNCHGASGAGGAAAFIEPRSGIATAWAAPSLNDVFFRYEEDEVRHWIVYGRPGTPMPSWGVAGGGPLNSQQVDELLAYIDHLQVSQAEAVAAVEGKVDRELARLVGADDSVLQVRTAIETDIAEIAAVPLRLQNVSGLPAAFAALLSGDGSCTAEAAAVVDEPCGSPGADTDRDGISDLAEVELNALVAEMLRWAPPGNAKTELEKIQFDPASGFTTFSGSTPIPDLDQVGIISTEFEVIERGLRLTLDSREALLDTALAGLGFVKDSAEQQRWAIDVEAIAKAEFDGNVSDAQRAAALYNAYCARCHTAGYSAGVAFTQEAGSGALGPSLRDGRSAVQFPDVQDHLDFVINGSVDAQPYGVNGIGRGWMPGFGTVLSEEDLMLIVEFERALR